MTLALLNENRTLRADLEEARHLLRDALVVLRDDLGVMEHPPKWPVLPMTKEDLETFVERLGDFLDGQGDVARARASNAARERLANEARTISATLARAIAHGGLVDCGNAVRAARQFIDMVGDVDRDAEG